MDKVPEEDQQEDEAAETASGSPVWLYVGGMRVWVPCEVMARGRQIRYQEIEDGREHLVEQQRVNYADNLTPDQKAG